MQEPVGRRPKLVLKHLSIKQVKERIAVLSPLQLCTSPWPRPRSSDDTPPIPYPTPFSPERAAAFLPNLPRRQSRQRPISLKRSQSESDWEHSLAAPQPLIPSSLMHTIVSGSQPVSMAIYKETTSSFLPSDEAPPPPRDRDESLRSPRFPLTEPITPITSRGHAPLHWPSNDAPKIYPRMYSLLTTRVASFHSPIRNMLVRKLREHANVSPVDGTVPAFIQSEECRNRLLQIASTLQLHDQPCVLEALHDDDYETFLLLQAIVYSDSERQIVKDLTGDAAQKFLDHAQRQLDNVPHSDALGVKLHRLLVTLSATSKKLPSSLFLEGITRTVQKPLAGGTFSDVYPAQYRGVDVALKCLRFYTQPVKFEAVRRNFCREALTWRRLKHPFVLPLLGIDLISFEPALCMVSPLMRRGTLLGYVEKHGQARINMHLLQIAKGLEYLHGQGVVHGDLRATNILIDDEENVQLADFGLTVFADATAGNTTCAGGSTRWKAPELWHPEQFGLGHCYRRTYASDVYALGCVVLEVCTGWPPFRGIPEAGVPWLVLNGRRPTRPDLEDMSEALWRLSEMCWSHVIDRRPRADEIAEYVQDLINAPVLG